MRVSLLLDVALEPRDGSDCSEACLEQGSLVVDGNLRTSALIGSPRPSTGAASSGAEPCMPPSLAYRRGRRRHALDVAAE